ncbi:MAG: hypothetical protein JWO00_565 [Candidatus Parcubacteria bacterium]|nr:hypothetical protein [Candidatus Parcubacteria bacterium]
MKHFGLKNRGVKNRGDILISVVVFAAITVTVTIGLVNWGAAMLAGIRTTQAKEQAFQIAEAGIDYYRWHLAQFPTDYTDGTTGPSPYYHAVTDKNDVVIGGYALTITPPPLGSTKVVITSTGTTTANPNVSRTVQATLAQPSLAQYAVIANDNLRFGAGTTIYGPVSSNQGIHFDGVAFNVVSSALATDTDPDNSCTPQPACAVEWGVFTQSGTDDPSPPTAANNRPDVFAAGRQYPVPAFPFATLAVNLSSLLTLSTPGGVCSAPRCWVSSGAQGYYMHLNTNNTYDMYTVNTLKAAPSGCTSVASQSQWGTWSINTKTLIGAGYAIPTNGIVFVKDNLWIDGQINGSRLTVAAADIGQTDPTKYLNITVNNDLLYTNFDGTDVIGLIAQNNVNVGLFSADSFTIDAALVAEIGRVGRFYYNSNCRSGGVSYYDRSSLTLNGMIATAIRYGFAYTDGTGYTTRNINYDGNLLYSPPPSFPLASTQYQTISWKQLK